MISLTINGKQESLPDLSLLELLQQRNVVPERVVLELNGEIVKRPLWNEVHLRQDDNLEIVCFVGGG